MRQPAKPRHHPRRLQRNQWPSRRGDQAGLEKTKPSQKPRPKPKWPKLRPLRRRQAKSARHESVTPAKAAKTRSFTRPRRNQAKPKHPKQKPNPKQRRPPVPQRLVQQRRPPIPQRLAQQRRPLAPPRLVQFASVPKRMRSPRMVL